MIGKSIFTAVVLAAFATLATPTSSTVECLEIFCSRFDDDTGFGRFPPSPRDAEFYRSFARPVRDPLRHIYEAGAWSLETDLRTKIAYPRIVHLANGLPASNINRALAAAHGRMIRLALENDRWVGESREDKPEPGSTSFQASLRVTYFSSRYISIVETGAETSSGSHTSIFARGVTADIERGTLFSVRPCNATARTAMFSFGDLLWVCSDKAFAAFARLWKVYADRLSTEMADAVLPDLVERCRWHALAYVDSASFALYLTPAGLAVHSVRYVSNSETQCVEDRHNPFNPVILPYRELRPFMKPGPLMDELLSQAAAAR